MFRRPAKTAPATPSAPSTPSPTDPGRVLNDLLAKPTLEGVLESTLSTAADLVGGNVKGYAVIRPGEDQIAAVLGYEHDLVGLQLGGPWSAGRARVVTDSAAELFATNPPEVRARLDVLGMRETKASLVAPLRDRNRFLGALVLDRYTGDVFTSAQLDAVSRWASSVTPLVALLESREEARALSRKLSSVFVDSIESLDFDSVGHARRVTEVAVQIGRSLNLSDRELDELWYAAMLHDLGKVHGEDGHAMIGANLLHDVPQLAGAQLGVRHHHERWDGFGEPDRLAGEEIPLAARIVAVADAFVRRGPDGLAAVSGTLLDPRIVAVVEAIPS
ncbi:HD-GYP domain-containing protein [Deinococcus pimensis]|uniref:HD-GYP domain-containing protein n=1 Tax=Deinococcus pimensis TaxID=309888 RepID=UPI00047F39A0|nr:HD domain-containing phosphohydrolase [Deinococcus pimensis]